MKFNPTPHKLLLSGCVSLAFLGMNLLADDKVTPAGDRNEPGNATGAGEALAGAAAIPGRNAVGKPQVRELADLAKDALKKSIPELPADLKAKKEALETQRQQLRDALKTSIQALGDDATKKQVAEVVAAFGDKNKETLEDLKKRESEVKEAIKTLAKDNVPDAVKAARDAMKEAQVDRKVAHEAFKKALTLADNSDEKRLLLDKFKEDQKIRHDELKAELKKIREQVRGGENAGDRRVDE